MNLSNWKTYLPFLAASLVAGFQLVWNATQYKNPIAMADVQAAGVTFGAVYGVVFAALKMEPPAPTKPGPGE